MTRQSRRVVGIALIVVALVVVVAVSVTSCGSGGDDGTAGLDRKSYQAGYDAFGGAYLPPSDADRRTDEAKCEDMWGGVPSDQLVGLKKHDWVVGCADAVENKKSRF